MPAIGGSGEPLCWINKGKPPRQASFSSHFSILIKVLKRFGGPDLTRGTGRCLPTTALRRLKILFPPANHNFRKPLSFNSVASQAATNAKIVGHSSKDKKMFD